MHVASLFGEVAAVAAGAWPVVRGDPVLGLLWLSVGVYLYERTGGSRD